MIPPHLRYYPAKQLDSRPVRHPDPGQAETEALHAADGASNRRKNHVQDDVTLEAVHVAGTDPALDRTVSYKGLAFGRLASSRIAYTAVLYDIVLYCIILLYLYH